MGNLFVFEFLGAEYDRLVGDIFEESLFYFEFSCQKLKNLLW